ncbi:hypothetical protein THAOC_24451, partial [Thalassiosira oceanica]
MDSAGRLSAVGIGGLQPQNGLLSNVICSPPAWTRSPTCHQDKCRLYELGSIGSAYFGLPILINSSGHQCAVDIGVHPCPPPVVCTAYGSELAWGKRFGLKFELFFRITPTALYGVALQFAVGGPRESLVE